MEFWTEVRRQVLADGLSKRAAVKKQGIRWHTLEKILKHQEPPGRCFPQQTAKTQRTIAFKPLIREVN